MLIPSQRRADGMDHPSWCDPELCFGAAGETEHRSAPLIDIQPAGDRTCRLTVRAVRADDQLVGPLEPTGFVLELIAPGDPVVNRVEAFLTIADLRGLGLLSESLAETVTVLTS